MLDRFLQQADTPLAAAVSRFEHEAGEALRRVDGLTGVAPTLLVASEPVEQPAELSFVVERGDDLVAAFVTLRIVSIPAYNVALNLVVIRVHGRHPTSVRRLLSRCRRLSEWPPSALPHNERPIA